MGQYLATPVTDKVTERGGFGVVEYGLAAQQGWRRSMEDAHVIAALEGASPPNDGLVGSEAAGGRKKRERGAGCGGGESDASSSSDDAPEGSATSSDTPSTDSPFPSSSSSSSGEGLGGGVPARAAAPASPASPPPSSPYAAPHAPFLLGIFDGHGGAEVAQFCSRRFASELVGSRDYRRGDVESSLVAAFHRMDELIRSPEGAAQVDSLREEARLGRLAAAAAATPAGGAGSGGRAPGLGPVAERPAAGASLLSALGARPAHPLAAGAAQGAANGGGGNKAGDVSLARFLSVGRAKTRGGPPPARLNGAAGEGGALPPKAARTAGTAAAAPAAGTAAGTAPPSSTNGAVSDLSASSASTPASASGPASTAASASGPASAPPLSSGASGVPVAGADASGASASGAAPQTPPRVAAGGASPRAPAAPASLSGSSLASALGLALTAGQSAGGGRSGSGLPSLLGSVPSRPSAVGSPAASTSSSSGPAPGVLAGCTAVVALVVGDRLFVANAGDSRAVLCRAGGAAVALSRDHRPADAAERARILAAGGFVTDVAGVTRINGNLNLSRAIGDLRYKDNASLPPSRQIVTAEPDVVSVALRDDDRFLVVACDGIWDVLTSQHVCSFVGARLDAGDSPERAAGALLDACISRDPRESRGIGCDNMTAAVVLLGREAIRWRGRRTQEEQRKQQQA